MENYKIIKNIDIDQCERKEVGMKNILLICGILMVAFTGCTSLKKTYNQEVRGEVEKYRDTIRYEVFTEEDIRHLPEPVRQYFRKCGYIGTEKMLNAEVVWSESYIKMAPDKKWMKLKTYQFNSIPEPMRAAYMKARLFGIFPFEGRDIYSGGYGNMHGRFVKMIKVFDEKGDELTTSALITLLAEVLFIPNYALQEYIEWMPIDDHTAKATIHHEGCTASGIFHFDDEGIFHIFESDDRYYMTPEGTYQKRKFSVYIDDYKEYNGVLIPVNVRAVWHLDKGEYEYWRGTISHIHYDIH